VSLPSIAAPWGPSKFENREHGCKSVGGWKAEVDREHLSTGRSRKGLRGLVRKEPSRDRVSDLVPWTRAARTIGRMGARFCGYVFQKKTPKHAFSSQGPEPRYDGRRSSRSTVSLSPALPKAAYVTKVSLEKSFLPYWSSERRCLRMQKNVRGGTVSSTSAPPAPKARRVGGPTLFRESDASKQVH